MVPVVIQFSFGQILIESALHSFIMHFYFGHKVRATL